jgi:hypothetical protein
MVDSNDPDLIRKLIEQGNALSKEKKIISEKINPWLERINSEGLSTNEKKQKTKEVIDLGHFLHFLNENIEIQEVFTESPDFILNSNDSLIGIELKDFIIREDEKEKEGLIKSVFKEIISEFEKDLKKYKGLYRVEFIEENFSLKRENRKIIKKEIIGLIKGVSLISKFIKRVYKTPYNGLGFQKGETTIVGNINKDLVQKKIDSKEKLVETYRQKEIAQIWLLLVIGGVEKSSDFCFFDSDITSEEFDSNFDRIFIYEFFDRKITELKITPHNNVYN